MVRVFSYGEVHLQRALTSREAGSMICLEVAWETQKSAGLLWHRDYFHLVGASGLWRGTEGEKTGLW